MNNKDEDINKKISPQANYILSRKNHLKKLIIDADNSWSSLRKKIKYIELLTNMNLGSCKIQLQSIHNISYQYI